MRDLPDIPDALIDALLEGGPDTERDELGLLTAFVHELRAVSDDGPEPRVDGRLATVLATGLTTDKGDLLVTAGSKANGSVATPQTAGLPKWQRLIERSNEHMQTLGRNTKAKIAAAVAVAFVGTLGMGAAGALPGPAQGAADRAFEAVGLDRADAETEDIETQNDHDGVEVQNEKPEGAGVDGSEISSEAQELEPGDGQEFGERVSSDASEHGTSTAGEHSGGASDGATTQQLPEESEAPFESVPPEDPGAQGDAGTENQPEGTHTAEDNPGSDFRPGDED